jgi:ABC-type glycerol-3-phosphate transport system substrate-binding protein
VSAFPDAGLSRRHLLKLGLGIGGSVLAGSSLSGCAGSTSTTAVTQGSVDLSMWTHDQGYIDFFSAVATDAAKSKPFNYSLNITKSGASDLVTKMIAQAVAGRGTPDLVGVETGNFSRLRREDLAEQLFTDLTPLVKGVADDLISARTAPYSRDGRLFALDSDSPLVTYYYRSDLFAKYGIPDAVPTWEEFAQLGETVRRSNDVAFGAVAVGSDLPQVTQGFSMLLQQRGGQFFDENGTLRIDSPEAEEVLTFIVNGLKSGFLTTVTDFYGPSMQAALKSGKIVGQWMATWYKTYGLLPNVPEQSGQWRIRALPRFSSGGTRGAFAGGTGFAVLKGKPNTTAATHLLSAAYLDPAEQVRRYQTLGYLPTLRSVFEDPALLAIEDPFCGGQKLFGVYSEIIDEAPAYHLSPNQNVLDTVLSGNLLEAYKGNISPKDALRQAAEAFRGQTREG